MVDELEFFIVIDDNYCICFMVRYVYVIIDVVFGNEGCVFVEIFIFFVVLYDFFKFGV